MPFIELTAVCVTINVPEMRTLRHEPRRTIINTTSIVACTGEQRLRVSRSVRRLAQRCKRKRDLRHGELREHFIEHIAMPACYFHFIAR